MSESVGGRPRIIQTPDEFDRLVDEYVAECREQNRPLTFTGMAFHLGFATRKSFYDYSKREEFCYSASRARLLIESGYEERLFGNSPSGAQFALKNHGWIDKQELEHAGPSGGPVEIAVTRRVVAATGDET